MTNDISRKIEFSAVHKIPFRVNYLRYCMVWKRNVGCSSVGAYYITLPDPLQDKVGTPTVWATMVDAILSPRAHIAEAGGPVHQTNRSFISIRQNMHKILLVSNPTKFKPTNEGDAMFWKKIRKFWILRGMSPSSPNSLTAKERKSCNHQLIWSSHIFNL